MLPIEDSIEKIFKTLGEAAVIHKNNGGTGFNFSAIRPHGDKVKNVVGAASGPVDFIKAFSAALSKILQGLKRQGGNMAILNVDHPDVEEFIRMKAEDGNLKNFNVSVGVSDEFMKAVRLKKPWSLVNPRTQEEVKKIRADRLFDLICKQAHKSGDPGVAFLDRMEKDNPTPTLGKIEATNPCLTGDMLIATDKGLVRFEELYRCFESGEQVGVVVDNRVLKGSGVGVNRIEKVIYSGKKTVYQLETKSGFLLKATKDHKILTDLGWKDLKRLRASDKVMIQAGEGQFSKEENIPFKWENNITGKNGRKYTFNLPLTWSKRLGVLLGWMVGDGFVRKNQKSGYAILTFGRQNKIARDYFLSYLRGWHKTVSLKEPTDRTYQVVLRSKFVADYLVKLGILPVKSDKKRVPNSIYQAPRETVIGFLQGLFSSDGTVGFVEKKSAYVRLTSKSKDLLRDVQLLLINLGIFSRIYDRSRQSRKNNFPAYKSVKGKVRRYGSDGILWELEISKDSVVKFLDEIGFLFKMHCEKIKKLRNKKYYKNNFFDQVVKVRKLGTRQVYDVVEPKTRSFIGNGIVVHNCGEIPLLPYESCNLTSIVLSNHVKGKEVDWEDLRKSVNMGVRFLDNMIEVNNYPIPKIERMVKEGNRRIGLGVMGLAHLFFKLGISYNSERAVKLSEKLARFIRKETNKETERLGGMRGNFGNYDVSVYADSGVPRRNCATTMIAPTGTISLFADCSSGIEPVFSLVTKRRTFFEDDMKNKPTKEMVIEDPVYKQFKNKYKRKVFVTSHEIDWVWHVKMQAAWQKYFDNSVSKTINFDNKATIEDIKKAYKLAYQLGCKGITIYRDGSKEDQVLNVSSIGEKVCPDCGANLEIKEGCESCTECGFSGCSV